jgi:hypothetical protein
MVTRRKGTSKGARGNSVSEVDEFLANLKHPLKAEIEAVRAIILGADTRIHESIKWNAPSFSVTDHFATFNLRSQDVLQVVFHRGAKARARASDPVISDPSGLLQWVAKDRCIAVLTDRKQIRSKKGALESIVKQWIGQMP